MASGPAVPEGDGLGSFKPYRSVLRFPSAPTRSDGVDEQPRKRPRSDFPPWRQPVGTAFFLLNSEFARLYGEDIPSEEADVYAAVLERTFRNFGEEKTGFDQVVGEWDGAGDMAWTLADEPMRGWVEGDKEVIYEEEVEAGPSRPRSVRRSFTLGLK